MANVYREPGIRVTESVTPQISPLIAAPTDLCIIGLSQGFQITTDRIQLTGTAEIPLPGLPSDATLQSVNFVKNTNDPSKGQSDGSGYVVSSDYTVGTVGILRVGAGTIPDNTVVTVNYSYIPNNYWDPIRLFDQASVESRFGSSLSADGLSLASSVSMATAIAFENGSPSVIVQPLFKRATPGDPTSLRTQPNTSQAAALSSWSDTLFNLRDIDDINVIVPIVGQSMTGVTDSVLLTIFEAVQDHMYFMAQSDQWIVSILGEDSSGAATVTPSTLQGHADTLESRHGSVTAQQTVMVSPTTFKRALPVLNQTMLLGGQYAAASIGGMLASRSTSDSLTRKLVSGFAEVTDRRTQADKDTDASHGLLVVEQKSNVIRVRHSITLDTSSSATRELSVVRSKHRMIESIRNTLDTQVIGNLIADANSPLVVAAAVEQVLAALLQSRDIVDYSTISSRLLSLEPTTIQVKFSYRPAFPVNYIDVEFALDLTTQTLSTATL